VRAPTFSLRATLAVAVLVLAGAAPAYAASGTRTACQQQLTSFSASAQRVPSGATLTGQVTIACRAGRSGVAITLAGDSPALTVPASVLVAYGSRTTSFTMTAGQVVTSVPVTVTASYGLDSLSAVVTVVPPSPAGVAVRALTLSATTVVGGGDPITATVELTTEAPADTVVYFYGSAYGPVSMTPTVTIPAGQRTGSMQARAEQVSSDYTYSLSAEVRGTTPAGAYLLITPGPFAVSLSSTTIARGGSATATVTLNGGPVASDAVVALSTTVAGASVPASVTIPAGATSATFRIWTSVTSSGTGRLEAVYAGVPKYVYFATY